MNDFFAEGYDDETFIPKQRIHRLLSEFEEELDKVQRVFHQHLPGQFQLPEHFTPQLQALRTSADELGEECSFLVERLISDYNHFKQTPDQASLDRLFNDVKNLQHMLVG